MLKYVRVISPSATAQTPVRYISFSWEKAVSITYSECVFVALGFQHAMRMRHIVICDLLGCRTFFPHYLMNDITLRGKKIIEHKMCVSGVPIGFV